MTLIDRIRDCGRLAVQELRTGHADQAHRYLAERDGLESALEGRYNNVFAEPRLRQAYEQGWEDGNKLKQLEAVGLLG